MNGLMRYAIMRRDDSGGDGINARFRDRTGREHYDNGRYAPMRSGYPDRYEPPHMGGYGRPPARSAYDAPHMGYYEPVRMGDEDDEEREGRRSWKIIENNGRSYSPRLDRDEGMRQIYGFADSAAPEAQLGARSGHAAARGRPTLTKEMAEEWMDSLQNADGTTGPHWPIEEVKRLMQQKNIHADPLKLWVAMNAEYSDGVAVNRKFGVDTPEFYLESAVARWLNDRDAVPDKPAAYYMYVVQH